MADRVISLSSARVRAALCWCAALACGASLTHRALHARDDSARADGNGGHAEIDFGGQWLMGRLLVAGRGPDLYSRHAQWAELRRAYPEPGDAERLMHWFMGADAPEWKQLGGAACAPLAVPSHPLVGFARARAAEAAVSPDLVARLNARAVGGPLYPPVHALLYAPLGALDPQPAYRAFQVLSALCVFVAALGVKALTGGRVWCSVAALLLFLYPGTRGALDLGQNSVLTLAIVVWGWALAARGRWGAGGAVWGLLAFKPVWGVALVLVPLLMRRWKFCAAMAGTGIALAALALPFVGAHSWFDWLRNGREASAVYTTDENWIDLSRDLQSLPRRALHDFAKPAAERDTARAAGLARGLWLSVLVGTVAVYLWRGAPARPTGLSAGFAFLGGYLSCFHFMYYDALISAAALFVLSAAREARRSRFAWACVAVGFAFENALNALRWEVAVAGVRFDTTVRFPWDTFALLALWAWAAARLVRRGEGA
jgi:arabinofuranan 3-O-arabinosyltransferase